MKLNKANLTALNVQCAEIYYNLLSDTYNARDGIPADAEDWERRLNLSVYYGQLALGECPAAP